MGLLLGEGQSPLETNTSYQGSPEENVLAEFSAIIMANTEALWNAYRNPTLVLFSGFISSTSGSASVATGPFYCPGDEKLYLDLTFFRDIKRRLNAPGDFAQAYVIAHEVGHHIQKILGMSDKIHRLRG